MAPRRRQPKKNKMVGNTRMDAALDAMKQLGFEEKLVRETVDELLDVYDGMQGWPFIEEASYKLLIETILCAEDKDDARKDGVGETSSAATPTTGITDVGSPCFVGQDAASRASNDLDSASHTNDHHDSAPIGNLEVEADVINVKDNNHKTTVGNVETTIGKSSMIESSKTSELPRNKRRPFHGWISDDDTVDLVYFPLPSRVEKMIGKSVPPEGRRRKSKWDEKPDDM